MRLTYFPATGNYFTAYSIRTFDCVNFKCLKTRTLKYHFLHSRLKAVRLEEIPRHDISILRYTPQRLNQAKRIIQRRTANDSGKNSVTCCFFVLNPTLLCFSDETEAHIDYEDNFHDDKDMTDMESNDDDGEDHKEQHEEDEDEERVSFNIHTEHRGNLEDARDLASIEKSSKAPTESPISMLSQKHLFWFPPDVFGEPESELEPYDATKTQFSNSDNRIGVKTDYTELVNKLHFDSEDFPIGPSTTKDAVASTDSFLLDGNPATQVVEEGGKDDGSMETDDIFVTTYQPSHVEVEKADSNTLLPNSDMSHILSVSTVESDNKEVQVWLTPTNAPENVITAKGYSDDMAGYHPNTRFGYTKHISTTAIMHDLSDSTPTVFVETSHTVRPDYMPFQTGIQSVTMYPTPDETEFTMEQDSERFLEKASEGTNLFATSEPCTGDYCPKASKGLLIAIIVVVLCLLLLATIMAVWCYKKWQQKSSVYNLNGKGQTRHSQQIEMQKV
ncbi:hypothetical protein FKM82_026486 [Ascaphus truei]